MEINIVIFINLLLYTVIVSQPFSYIIALSNVQKNLQPHSYIELRKLLDKNFRKKNSVVVYGVLASSTLLTILCSVQPDCLLFITSSIAWVLLISDLIFTFRGNMPINNIINTWTTGHYPDDWFVYRTKWLAIFQKRQIVTITGFMSLLTGAVFGK